MTVHIPGENKAAVAKPVVENAAEEYIKNPPNNLNLADPTEQSRTNDLIGTEGTEPIADDQSPAEKKRVEKLAAELNAKGTL